MNQHPKPWKIWLAFGVSALALGAAAFSLPRSSVLPKHEEAPMAQVSADAAVLQEGCELLQTLTYTRCEHTVTRRFAAPPELTGLTLEEAAALYPEWRITEFAPALVKMEQQPDLFCPDHIVVMPGGAGYLCVFENRYGDALALVRELDVEMSALPAAVQEEAERGIGFSTAEELEMWLESVES